MKKIKEISGDIETRFRRFYPSVINELGSVMMSLKHVLTSPSERKKINSRLGKTGQWQGYVERLIEARKNILAANGLLKNSSMSKINLFPFQDCGRKQPTQWNCWNGIKGLILRRIGKNRLPRLFDGRLDSCCSTIRHRG